MGTHPIFESDFDCLTVWSKDSLIVVGSLTTPPPTVAKLSRPLVENLFTNTSVNLRPSQNVATPETHFVELKLPAHDSFLKCPNERRRCPVLMEVPSVVLPFAAASSERF